MAVAAAPFQATDGPHRQNETTSAGLLPARTSITKAQAILGDSTIEDAQIILRRGGVAPAICLMSIRTTKESSAGSRRESACAKTREWL